MLRSQLLNICGLFLLLFLSKNGVAQLNLSYSLDLAPDYCAKGSAALTIGGEQLSDSVVISWSTGEMNTKKINNLNGGEHNVHVYVKRRLADKKSLIKDTILFYSIEKVACEVQVARFFSPNDDQYNDELNISNIQNYPNFELEIYNKWGQRVHSQKKNYTPWDGKWLGVNLPDGSYYFVLFYDAANKSRLVKGDITLLR